MYTLALDLLKRYLPQIIFAIAVIVALALLKHQIFEDGRFYERAIWEEDKAKTDKDAAEFLDEERNKYEAALEKQKNDLIGAFNESQKLNDQLERDLADSRNHRMFVNTKKPTNCSAQGKAEAASSGGIGGTGAEVYRQELDPGTEQAIRDRFAEIADGANACKLLLERFVLPNMEIVE